MIIPEKIVNPIGLDKKIQEMQTKLQNLNFIEICYGKAERVYNENKKIPFVNLNSKDYFEVLQNDNVKSHLFFLPDEEANALNYPYMETGVSVYVFADLMRYNPKKNRATEEIINEFTVNIYNSDISKNWKLNKIIKGIDKSLTEFEIKNYQKLQPFFVFRLDYIVKYEIQNVNCF